MRNTKMVSDSDEDIQLNSEDLEALDISFEDQQNEKKSAKKVIPNPENGERKKVKYQRRPMMTRRQRKAAAADGQDVNFEDHSVIDELDDREASIGKRSRSKQSANRTPSKKASTRSKNINHPQVQSPVSLTSNAFNSQFGKSKKRTLEQLTTEDNLMGGMNPANGNPQNLSSLWTEKYQPKTLEELAVAKKKVTEFIELAQGSEAANILILHGATGCGKNALINAFCSQFDHKLIKYTDKKNLRLVDTYGEQKQVEFSNQTLYQPDDFVNLIEFINTAALSSTNTARAKPSVSSFCTSSFASKKQALSLPMKNSPLSNEITKSQDSMIGARNSNEKTIYVIQGLPECLKLISIARHRLISEFNQSVHNFLTSMDQRRKKNPQNQFKLPLLIFTFSDPSEKTQTFFNKMFSKSLRDHKRFKTLALNPPTDKEIDKVLRNISTFENLQHRLMSENKLLEIRTQANRDLRNAIVTLQFESAGCQIQKLSKPSTPCKLREPTDHTKDIHFSIFHALGKFLYNKRINPRTKAIEQLPFKMMKNPDTRPEIYFSHQEIITQSMLEPSLFQLYLHQNVPQFYADIDDMADCLDNFSQQDAVCATVHQNYSYAAQQEMADLEQLMSFIFGMTVTETNLHCSEVKKGMVTMQVPAFFDHQRQQKQSKLALRDVLKESQFQSEAVISEDLLIRSQNECQLNIVPFLQQMQVREGELSQLIASLDSFKIRRGEQRHGTVLGQDEAAGRSNMVLEERLNEQMMYEARRRRYAGRTAKTLKFESNQANLAEDTFKAVEDVENDVDIDDEDINLSELEELMGDMSMEEDIDEEVSYQEIKGNAH